MQAWVVDRETKGSSCTHRPSEAGWVRGVSGGHWKIRVKSTFPCGNDVLVGQGNDTDFVAVLYQLLTALLCGIPEQTPILVTILSLCYWMLYDKSLGSGSSKRQGLGHLSPGRATKDK